MKNLYDICEKCKHKDWESDFPNLWCDKYTEMINEPTTVQDMAKLGCEKCKEVITKNERK